MIRFTGYVTAEKPHVGHLGQIFRAPCSKKNCVRSKNDITCFIGLYELYHHAKFGKIVQRAQL